VAQQTPHECALCGSVILLSEDPNAIETFYCRVCLQHADGVDLENLGCGD
jgi:hypothetical protein